MNTEWQFNSIYAYDEMVNVLFLKHHMRVWLPSLASLFPELSDYSFLFLFKLNYGQQAFNPQIRIFVIDSLWFGLSPKHWLLSPILSEGFNISFSEKSEFCSRPSADSHNGLSPL